MIKVMFDIYQFCDHVHGGVYTYFYNLLEELMLTGEIETCFAAEGNYSVPVHSEVKRFIKHENTLRYIPMGNFELFPHRAKDKRNLAQRLANRMWWTSMDKLERKLKYNRQRSFFGNDADICHYTDHFHPKVVMPTVATIHDLIWKNKPEFFTKKHLEITTRYIDFVVENSDHFITVSHKTKNQLIHHFKIPESKITVTHLGIDSNYSLDNDSSQKQALFSRLGLTNEPYFVCLSTLEPRKNHQGVINAFIELKRSGGFENHQLLLIGPSGWKFDKVKEEIGKSEWAESIHITGFLEPTEIRQALNDAVALVFPSFDEGFGLPPVEAMACGCPVVASRLGSLPEVLGDYAEYVDAYSSHDIARGMASLAKDAQYRHKLVQDGLEWVKRYDYAKTARQTIDVYKMLIQKDREHPRAKNKIIDKLGIFNTKEVEPPQKEETEKPQCPQCGSLEHKQEYILRRDPKPDALICRCKRCGLIFSHLRQGDSEICGSTKEDNAISRTIKQPPQYLPFDLQLLNSYAQKGEVLDIGWTWPLILKEAKETGFEISVQEIQAVLAKVSQAYLGLDIRAGSLEESAWEEERFEAITLFDSLTSLEKPWDHLSEIDRILKPQGILIIRTPNFDSYLRTIQRRNWPFLDPDCSSCHFNRQTLEKMLLPFFDILKFVCHEDEISRQITSKIKTEEEIQKLEKDFQASQLLVIARKK